MRCEGKEYPLLSLGSFSNMKYGKMPKKDMVKENGKYPVFSGYRIVGYCDECNLDKQQLIVVARGVGGTGDVKLSPGACFLTNLSIAVIIDENIALKQYLFYYFQKHNLRYLDSGSAQSQITIADLKNIVLPIPPLEIQSKIVEILSSFDDKIELNNKINENLLEQVFSLYRNMFIETVNDQRLVCRASAYFDISIGKTPPRKEQQWFSNQPTDCVWVSIADMGNCGVYISDSSEYLTHEAVERFNVKLIPSNTVILSFKLTVGRVAITDGIMTTNEAIAHFKTEIPAINEYLYCYLKEFNYETMGSTSSIATAVNSKIIKGMPFVVPTNEELNEFHNLATPLFMMIKSNQRENKNMSELRDTLLPKLLNGEINV